MVRNKWSGYLSSSGTISDHLFSTANFFFNVKYVRTKISVDKKMLWRQPFNEAILFSIPPLGKLKKKKKWMDLVHNGGGGGVSGRVHFSRFFLTFNVKIIPKNWKRTIKQWWRKKHSPFLGGAGGFQVSWTKSIQMFF